MKRSLSLLLCAALLLGALAGCNNSQDSGGLSDRPESSDASEGSSGGEQGEQAEQMGKVGETDVIIVGGGLAGMVATINAAEADARVILFEGTGSFGGNARYAAGYISGAQTRLQADADIEDSYDQFYENLIHLARGEDNLNKEIARFYADSSGKAVDWLLEQGVDFNPEPHYGVYDPLNVRRVYTTDGAGAGLVTKLTGILETYVDEGKVDVRPNTLVTQLVMEDGACKGVKTDDQATYHAKSVILATGGYTHKEELFREVYARVKTGTPQYCNGNGLELAEQAGAQTHGFDYSFSYGGALDLDESFAMTKSINIRYPGVIWVDKTASRVVDEYAVDAKLRADAWLDAPDNTIYVIFNQSALINDTPIISGDENNQAFKELEEGGQVVFSGDTVAELAEATGLDVTALESTVSRYNSFVSNGEDDDFGRTENMMELTGPFYAVETIPYVITNFGGVVIDDQTRVLDKQGEAIPGLYAAGEVCSFRDIAGENTCAGSFLGHAVTFGKQAGTVAAA